MDMSQAAKGFHSMGQNDMGFPYGGPPPPAPPVNVEPEMQVPRRFKTAFIFFSSARHKEIKHELAKEGKTEKTTNIAKALSKEWKAMTPEVREGWEAKSRADKERYQREMAVYKETNRMSSKKPKKDPSAPKRPMSAFLAFSNKRRAALKREHPDSTNADLSKMLSKMWKEIDPAYKAEYVEDEAQKRAQYKLDIVKWRKKKAEQTRAINKAAAAAEKTATAAAAAAPPQAMMTATSTSDAAKRMEAFNNSNMAPMNQFNGGGYASQFLSNAGMMSQQPHHQFFPPQGVPSAQQQMMGMSGMSSLVPNQYQQQHALLQYQQLVQQQNALQQQQFSMDGAGSPQQQKHYMGGFAPGPPMP